MALYGRIKSAWRRKAKDVETKQKYLKLYESRINRGDKTVPTFANWLKRSQTKLKRKKKPAKKRTYKTLGTRRTVRGLKRAGLSAKEIARLQD